MRKILVFLGLCGGFTLNAQAQLYVIAGINKTEITMSPTLVSTQLSGGYAWQAGISAEFPIEEKGFLYTGLLYETKKTNRKYAECCYSSSDETYHPHYISLPVGGGIRLPVGKLVQLQFSGGTYISFAAGGNVDGVGATGDIIAPKPVYYNRRINFGGAASDDMTQWNWGLQLRYAIKWNKFELQLSYNHGISNLVPDKRYASNGYLTEKYRSANLNFAYRLLTFNK